MLFETCVKSDLVIRSIPPFAYFVMSHKKNAIKGNNVRWHLKDSVGWCFYIKFV